MLLLLLYGYNIGIQKEHSSDLKGEELAIYKYAMTDPGGYCVAYSMYIADQRLAIGTDGMAVGYAVTAGFSTSVANTDGTVGVQTGYLKGIITKIHNDCFDVKVVSNCFADERA